MSPSGICGGSPVWRRFVEWLLHEVIEAGIKRGELVVGQFSEVSIVEVCDKPPVQAISIVRPDISYVQKVFDVTCGIVGDFNLVPENCHFTF